MLMFVVVKFSVMFKNFGHIHSVILNGQVNILRKMLIFYTSKREQKNLPAKSALRFFVPIEVGAFRRFASPAQEPFDS